MKNAFMKWYSMHSISAKSVASVWIFLTGMWVSVPAFKDYVFGIYNALPHGLHAFIAGVVVPALIFWRTQRKTTVSSEVAPGTEGKTAAAASVTNDQL